jgi:hypothetical protein
MALAGVVMLLVGAVALFAGVMETQPGLLEMLGSWTNNKFLILSGIGLGLAVVFAVFGLIIGRAGAR